MVGWRDRIHYFFNTAFLEAVANHCNLTIIYYKDCNQCMKLPSTWSLRSDCCTQLHLCIWRVAVFMIRTGVGVVEFTTEATVLSLYSTYRSRARGGALKLVLIEQ